LEPHKVVLQTCYSFQEQWASDHRHHYLSLGFRPPSDSSASKIGQPTELYLGYRVHCIAKVSGRSGRLQTDGADPRQERSQEVLAMRRFAGDACVSINGSHFLCSATKAVRQSRKVLCVKVWVYRPHACFQTESSSIPRWSW